MRKQEFFLQLTKRFIILNITAAFMANHKVIAQSSPDTQDYEIQPREGQQDGKISYFSVTS